MKLPWHRLPWLALFAAACILEFFAQWLKTHAGERLKGEPPKETP